MGHARPVPLDTVDGRVRLGNGLLVRGPCASLRSCLGAPAFEMAVVQGGELLQPLFGQVMFGEEVREVFLAQYFLELHPSAPHSLLRPERVGVEVPQLAWAVSRADA